jgi:hypothetical protein
LRPPIAGRRADDSRQHFFGTFPISIPLLPLKEKKYNNTKWIRSGIAVGLQWVKWVWPVSPARVI